jgi:uncharacterized repeat protein (TIGR03803 family)
MSYELIHTYDGSDGSGPQSKLVMISGELYGTTSTGGNNNRGIIFKINSEGTHTILYHFGSSGENDGDNPHGGLIANADNTVLYGTTVSGGSSNSGTIYSILPNGSDYNVLYNFDFRDQYGCNPYAGLFLSNDKLYGTNFATGDHNAGTIFAYDISGASLSLVHGFTGGAGGSSPKCTLIRSGNLLYGTTMQGGDNNTGTIFSYNLINSTFTVMYSFTATTDGINSDGANPVAELLLYNNNLYGTAISGGNGTGTVFVINKYTNTFTTMHLFESNTSYHGAYPYGGLILFGGVLYGTTSQGGATIDGSTIYTISPVSPYTFNISYALNGGITSEGDGSSSTLLRNDNILYGSNSTGGSNNAGTIFKYTVAVICYNENTQILMLDENGIEEYKLIQDIRVGDSVKIYPSGYKKVESIGNKTMINNSKMYKDCMYIMKKNDNNRLTDDLIVTGEHSIYVDCLSENEKSKQSKFKIVHGKCSLLSRNSDNFTKLTDNNKYTYYHFVLENNDDSENYIVWANGILSESVSKSIFNRSKFMQ